MAFEPFTGRPLATIRAGGSQVGAQTRNGRWLLVTANLGNLGYFADVQAERVARDNVPNVYSSHLTAGLSNFFITNGASQTEEIRRYTIRD